MDLTENAAAAVSGKRTATGAFGEEAREDGEGEGKKKARVGGAAEKELVVPPASASDRKSRHREVERRRTQRMNALVDQLRTEVESAGRAVEANKASVLAASIGLISDLRREVALLRSPHDAGVGKIVRGARGGTLGDLLQAQPVGAMGGAVFHGGGPGMVALGGLAPRADGPRGMGGGFPNAAAASRSGVPFDQLQHLQHLQRMQQYHQQYQRYQQMQFQHQHYTLQQQQQEQQQMQQMQQQQMQQQQQRMTMARGGVGGGVPLAAHAAHAALGAQGVAAAAQPQLMVPNAVLGGNAALFAAAMSAAARQVDVSAAPAVAARAVPPVAASGAPAAPAVAPPAAPHPAALAPLPPPAAHTSATPTV